MASRRRIWIVFGLVLLACVLGAGTLFLRKHHHLRRESARRQEDAARGPMVMIATVQLGPAERELTLPADVRAFAQATVYAKTAGYLERLDVDRGDHVRRGQRLAVIASPETDRQVAEARSDLALRDREARRARTLASRDFISLSDLDQAETARMVSEASLARVRALRGYQVLRAPFDGVVTARYVDPGTLIPAASGSTSGALPIVDVADLTRLKVLVYVGQEVAAFLHAGDPVHLESNERPDLHVPARITRFSPALDPRSRTMLAEIWIDNTPPRLYPGMYVVATLHVPAPSRPQVPSAALFTRDGKVQAAIVSNGRIRIVPVAIGIDDGKTAQVLSGLSPGEKVALNLPAEVPDGAAVQTVQPGQINK